jgi:hypothetical protein
VAQTVAQFDKPVVHTDGTHHRARVCGRVREDGLWEGWLEFENMATGEVTRTVRETTQPNLTDLKYWATGLTEVYLQGAVARTLDAPQPIAPVTVTPPHYDRPASRREPEHVWPESVLNPFSVYAKNPNLLAQELTALRGWHLRQIIRDYELVDDREVRLDSMTESQLGSLIMQRVRELNKLHS